jgi:hypothetical protein
MILFPKVGASFISIFPDLVASWVTGQVGHNGGLEKSARLDDDELEPRSVHLVLNSFASVQEPILRLRKL